MSNEFLTAGLYGIKTFNEKVKEKSGFIKLLNLLNEFETPQSGVVFKSYDNYDGTFYGVDCDGETEVAWSDSFICSKRFQWIEWLVDNDKIDMNADSINSLASELGEEGDYETVLMLLSIQDKPIRFLISILK